MAIHLISDLHLHADEAWLGELLTRCLNDWAGQIDALYILGDLFEYWVGDDDDDAFNEQMLAAMRAFSQRTPLLVMHGNRDFLLGNGFCQRSGAQLLTDPHTLPYQGHNLLLSHGDALCTDDIPYQQFRQMVRQDEWQQAFLQKPLAERHAIARQIRAQSQNRKQSDGMSDISDVNQQAVEALLAANPGHILIHGHTHRPAHHSFLLDNEPRERHVIADWHNGCGGYLAIDATGIQSQKLQW